MTKRKRDAVPVAPVVGGLHEGGVDIVMSKSGRAFFRPDVRPRAWSRMPIEAQETLAGLQAIVGQMRQMEEHVAEHVLELREMGASWDLIGWSLGMTGEGTRKRFGLADDDD